MIPVLWQGQPPSFQEAADRRVRQVLESFRLERDVRGVFLKSRPGQYGDDAWIRWTHRRPIRVWLELEIGAFLGPARRAQVREAALPLAAIPSRCFSPRSFLDTLFHEFAHIHDELRHGIRAEAVPPSARQAFNEVWNVWIDGRLQRSGKPGLKRRARLAFFRSTFPGALDSGRIFDELWNADSLDHEALIRAVQGLKIPLARSRSPR